MSAPLSTCFCADPVELKQKGQTDAQVTVFK
jgi:hypothetical protein